MLGTHTVATGAAKRNRSVSSKDEVASWLGMKRRKTGRGLTELNDRSAERETLVSLIATVETLSKRKSQILQTIKKFNEATRQLPYKGDFSNHDIGRHFAWLLANLQTTNGVLSKARRYLEILYVKAIYKKM